MPLFWARSVQSILLLLSHLHPSLASCLFPSVLPHHVCTSPVCHTCHMPCPSASSFDHPNVLGEEYRSWSSSLSSLLHSPLISSPLCLNIFFGTPFPNIVSLWVSLNMRVQVPHPYKTISKITFLFILTLRLLMSYIYGAPSKARNANVVYIWTYVWQRRNSLFLFAAQCFKTESMQRGFLCHICV